MKYNRDKHHRCSIRLKGYNYSSAAAYFVTICAYHHQCLFRKIIDGNIELNDIGQIIADEWLRSAEIRQEIEFDQWIIMPNHIHEIVVINQFVELPYGVGANDRLPLQGSTPHMKPRSLSSFIVGFKSITTKRFHLATQLLRSHHS